MLQADLLIKEAIRLAKLEAIDQDMIHSINVHLLVVRFSSLSMSSKHRAIWSMSNLIAQMQQSGLRDLTRNFAKSATSSFDH